MVPFNYKALLSISTYNLLTSYGGRHFPIYIPPPQKKLCLGGGGGVYIGISLSVCLDQLPHLLSDFHQTLWNLRS